RVAAAAVMPPPPPPDPTQRQGGVLAQGGVPPQVAVQTPGQQMVAMTREAMTPESSSLQTSSSHSSTTSPTPSSPLGSIKSSNKFFPSPSTTSIPESVQSSLIIESKSNAPSTKERFDVPIVDCKATSSIGGISLTLSSSMSSIISR
ncbi:Unknown protein, partial [Striga hermonthica]